VRAYVAPEDARGARRRLVKAQQRVDQRALAGSVGAQQADGSPRELGFQIFQDGAVAEADFQAIQFYDGVHSLI
jgi:hypothetical protein